MHHFLLFFLYQSQTWDQCLLIGLKKSLLNVFQDEICHPKMAMVIDDRLKVWDDKDQPRVHVVPAYAPYYAPQAEVCGMLFIHHFEWLTFKIYVLCVLVFLI